MSLDFYGIMITLFTPPVIQRVVASTASCGPNCLGLFDCAVIVRAARDDPTNYILYTIFMVIDRRWSRVSARRRCTRGYDLP